MVWMQSGGKVHTIKGAIKRVKDMRAEVDRGDKQSIFRNKQQIMMAKNDKKDWSNTWYL